MSSSFSVAMSFEVSLVHITLFIRKFLLTFDGRYSVYNVHDVQQMTQYKTHRSIKLICPLEFLIFLMGWERREREEEEMS
jgi:hypothetical protein